MHNQKIMSQYRPKTSHSLLLTTPRQHVYRDCMYEDRHKDFGGLLSQINKCARVTSRRGKKSRSTPSYHCPPVGHDVQCTPYDVWILQIIRHRVLFLKDATILTSPPTTAIRCRFQKGNRTEDENSEQRGTANAAIPMSLAEHTRR